MNPTETSSPIRDKERTRRAILEAAQQTFTEQGAAASLAEIANTAGITKSGLMHHFSSRDALIHAVAQYVIDRAWEEVHAHIDLSENRPGKFTRGYIRAMTGGSDFITRLLNPTSLMGSTVITAELDGIYRLDAKRLNDAFAADGLPHARSLAIRFAAEGLTTAIGGPYLTAADLELAREELIGLTESGSYTA